MPLIVDASVAIKLVAAEPGSDAALALLDRAEERIAPDWMLCEAASALAKKVRHDGLGASDAEDALRALPSFFDQLFPAVALLTATMRLAAQLDHSTYDCLYLALAQTCDGTVVTADGSFVKAVVRAGFGEQIEHLTWT